MIDPSSITNWPAAFVAVVTLLCTLAGLVVNGWILLRQAELARTSIATTKAVAETNVKVDTTTLKVGQLGEILNEQGQRIDGRLTELLIASIAKAHAEGMLAGTKDEQNRLPDQKKQGPSIQPIIPVEIRNPEPIPVVQTPEKRLGEIRGDQP